MAREEQSQDEQSDDDAVPAKEFEAIFSNETDKPFHGKDGYHKRDQTADEQRGDIARHVVEFASQDHLQHLQARGSQHGGHGQEEGKLCRALTRQSVGHTTDDGCHTAADTRYHGQTLAEADAERTLLGDGVGLLAMAEPLVAEQHEDTTNNQHDSNDRDAAADALSRH